MTARIAQRKTELPDPQELLRVFTYDPLTGELRWAISRPGRYKTKAGDIAGTKRPDGYQVVTYKNIRMLVHRVIWAMQTGAWPEGIVDHRDTDPSNNRWKNLREATEKQSAANRGVYSTSKLGIKGIRVRNGRYLVQATSNGKQVFLGSFLDLDAAKKVYADFIEKRDGEWARVA